MLGAAAFGLGIWALVDKNKMNVLTKVGAENSNFDVVGKEQLSDFVNVLIQFLKILNNIMLRFVEE